MASNENDCSFDSTQGDRKNNEDCCLDYDAIELEIADPGTHRVELFHPAGAPEANGPSTPRIFQTFPWLSPSLYSSSLSPLPVDLAKIAPVGPVSSETYTIASNLQSHSEGATEEGTISARRSSKYGRPND